MQNLSASLLGWLSQFLANHKDLVNLSCVCKNWHSPRSMDFAWRSLYLRDWEAASLDDPYIAGQVNEINEVNKNENKKEIKQGWRDRYMRRCAIERQWDKKPAWKLEHTIQLLNFPVHHKELQVVVSTTKLTALVPVDEYDCRLEIYDIASGKRLSHHDMPLARYKYKQTSLVADDAHVAVYLNGSIVLIFSNTAADLQQPKQVQLTLAWNRPVFKAPSIEIHPIVKTPSIEIHDKYLLFTYSTGPRASQIELWDWQTNKQVHLFRFNADRVKPITAKPHWRSMRLYVCDFERFSIYDLTTGKKVDATPFPITRSLHDPMFGVHFFPNFGVSDDWWTPGLLEGHIDKDDFNRRQLAIDRRSGNAVITLLGAKPQFWMKKTSTLSEVNQALEPDENGFMCRSKFAFCVSKTKSAGQVTEFYLTRVGSNDDIDNKDYLENLPHAMLLPKTETTGKRRLLDSSLRHVLIVRHGFLSKDVGGVEVEVYSIGV